MDIRDVNGTLEVRCAVCQGPAQGAGAVVGVHGPDSRAYHSWCADPSDYFLRADADRVIPLAQFIAELAQAAGV
jgi:hypothetical protein